jgi:hypothetical protein
VNSHNIGIVNIHVFHELTVHPPQKLGFGELFLVDNWWDNSTLLQGHSSQEHTQGYCDTVHLLLEKDELSLLVPARQCFVLYFK